MKLDYYLKDDPLHLWQLIMARLTIVDLLGGAHVGVGNLADRHAPRLQHLQHLLPVGCLCDGGDVKNDPVRHFGFFWILLCLETWWQMTGGQLQVLI